MVPLPRRAYLFKGLTDDEIRLVAASCAEEERDSGDVIFVEGSTADRFYIVMEGRVEVWKNYYDPKPDLLAVHGSGRFFGEMALIDELPRSATVVAKEKIEAPVPLSGRLPPAHPGALLDRPLRHDGHFVHGPQLERGLRRRLAQAERASSSAPTPSSRRRIPNGCARSGSRPSANSPP